VEAGVRTAVEVAGPSLGAVRIDSGDLLALAHEVRALLDELGAKETRIVCSGDLDEYGIAALAAAPVDSYGVGTSLVTGSGAPTAGLVYKLVAREAADGTMVGVAKTSVGKPTHQGRKWARRRLDGHGTAVVEVVSRSAEPSGDDERPLLRPLVVDGEVVGAEPLANARQRHVRSRAELPRTAMQLSRGEPAIPTTYEEGA
jgi:nicotinate phosphoribosyltransferase